MDAQELKRAIGKKIEKESTEQLTAFLVKVGNEKGAKAQLRLADMMVEDHGGNLDLAAEITAQQSHKISQWGGKAYPLSEKQCAVIARAAKYQFKGA